MCARAAQTVVFTQLPFVACPLTCPRLWCIIGAKITPDIPGLLLHHTVSADKPVHVADVFRATVERHVNKIFAQASKGSGIRWVGHGSSPARQPHAICAGPGGLCLDQHRVYYIGNLVKRTIFQLKKSILEIEKINPTNGS